MRVAAKTKALILKRDEEGYIALTPEGDFCRLPLSLGDLPVGKEVEVRNRKTGLVRVLALAACLLLILLGWQLYPAVLPPAAAYVSLDINPSLELALDAGGRVVEVAPLDQGGQKLVEGQELKRKPLDEAIEKIIRTAVEQGYIYREGVVMATLVPAARGETLPVATDQVAGSIESALQENNVATRVLVTSASEQEREEARNLGVSAGKYLLVKAAEEKGKHLRVQEMAEEGILEFEARYSIRVEQLLQERDKEGKSSTVIRSGAEKKPKPQAVPGHLQKKDGPVTPPGPSGGPALRPRGETENMHEQTFKAPLQKVFPDAGAKKNKGEDTRGNPAF